MSILISKILEIEEQTPKGKTKKKYLFRLNHVARARCELNFQNLGTTAGAHKPTFFSLRGPERAIHQRAPKARVMRMGRMDGWMDRWTGNQQCSSIYLKLKHVTKYYVLISNMVSNVIYSFFIPHRRYI